MRASDARGIELRPTPHRSSGRGGEVPRLIVLHTTAGAFESTAAWFAHPDSGVSAHYLVALDGRIAQFVDERDTARHAGRILRPTAALGRDAGPDGANPFSIGIEFEDAGDPLGVERPAAQYETGVRLIRSIAERWGIPLDRDHVVGHRELFAAKDCPGNLDVDRLVELACGLAPPGPTPLSDRPRLACLLPARDAAEDIPGYLESAAALGASVIALDDGSSDATAALLEASPQVVALLRKPPRAPGERWDDGANRAALLDAARDFAPDWVLFLDADERVDPDDARALREFLDSDALPGIAYGLALYRQWGDEVVSRPTHVFRMFAFRPDHELRPGRLHFNPVPVQIPRRAWVRTTVRARHLDSPERLARRRAKYAQADPAGADTGATAELLREPRGSLVAWRPRRPGLPVLPGPGESSPDVAEAGGAEGEPSLAVLLPARNCAADIPGFLECARTLGARVIALDDGSTDSTAALLDASPLVTRLLRNPRRETYAGWDDAANRQALLDAAIEDGVRWALFLDADERIAPDDVPALRRFLAHEADPAAAYGFRIHRMVRDEETYDRAGLWVYRLFAPVPGQRLPEQTLHLVPIPISIPRERWRKTTIRIKHLASLDEERRIARLRKYEQADPDRRWQRDYAGPLLESGEPHPWRARPPGLPALAAPLGSGEPLEAEAFDPSTPVLSAIVIATDDEATIERSVAGLLAERLPLPFEVIVVVSGSRATADVVREAFGERVTLVELNQRVPPGRARNEGVCRARGEYLSFPGSHVEIAAGSLAVRLAAHEHGWAMVTGSIVNGNTTRPGWASYFLDHSSALPGRPSGPLEGAPAHCSYVREFVLEAGGFPEDVRAGEDTVLNQELWRRGHRAYRESSIRLTHRSPCSTVARLLRHHFVRGRAFGRILRGDFGPGPLAAARPGRVLRGYVRRRLAHTDQRVEDWGEDLAVEYRRARPLVRLGVVAAWAGARFELAFGRSGRAAEHLRGGHDAEATGGEAGEDRRQGRGRESVAGVVQQHDRSGVR